MNNQDNRFTNFMSSFNPLLKCSPFKEDFLNQTPLPNSENRPNNQNSSPYYNYNLISRYVTPKKLDFGSGIIYSKLNTPAQIKNDINFSPFISNSKIEMSGYKMSGFRKNSLIELSPFKPMTNNNLTPLNKIIFTEKK